MKVGGVSGDKSTQTTVNSLDPLTQQWRDQLFKASQGAGAAGPGAGMNGANDYYSQMMKAGGTGTSALAGDPTAVGQMMSPYQQNVIDAMQKQWGNINAQTTNQVNSNATEAGAFGGSRAAVANGAALSGNNIAQAGQTAGLLQSGFSDAMNRAGMLAQGGYAGAGGAAGLGMQGVGNPDLWRMMMLRGGLMGTPTGGSTGTSKASYGFNFEPKIG